MSELGRLPFVPDLKPRNQAQGSEEHEESLASWKTVGPFI